MEISVLDSIPNLNEYKSFTERYFSKRYVLNVDGIENNDIMLMFHSNRVILLSLAPSHFFFKRSDKYKMNFNIGKIDRLKNTVKGKGKRGGQYLLPNSTVCRVEYEDNTGFGVPSCMKGTLVEVNEDLISQPELLREFPDSYGFIAIVISSIENAEKSKNNLLTHEEYIKKFEIE